MLGTGQETKSTCSQLLPSTTCLSRFGTSSVIVRPLPLSYCSCRMARNSDTLKIGDSAPSFSLWAANEFNAIGAPVEMRLQDLIQRTPVVLEFLRGTW